MVTVLFDQFFSGFWRLCLALFKRQNKIEILIRIITFSYRLNCFLEFVKGFFVVGNNDVVLDVMSRGKLFELAGKRNFLMKLNLTIRQNTVKDGLRRFVKKVDVKCQYKICDDCRMKRGKPQRKGNQDPAHHRNYGVACVFKPMRSDDALPHIVIILNPL